MIDPKGFLESLIEKEISFFAGVPDSLLKNLCACIDDVLPRSNHIITANEGGAISVAAGYYLATDKIPVVYMQNSGLGNTINPLLSLVDKEVYSIPMLLVVGWRGEPGVLDEPQHVKQGAVTVQMLESIDVPYSILPDSGEEFKIILDKAVAYMRQNMAPYVLIIKKDTFEKYSTTSSKSADVNVGKMSREEVLSEILDNMPGDDVYVGTTGKLSRELFELRKSRSEGHEKDFLTVGSMGHASQIALGIAEQKKDKIIVCLDGDGAALMHLGGMVTIGERKPENFIHFIFNNGVHESVGGQDVTGKDVDYTTLATSVGYKEVFRVSDTDELRSVIKRVLNGERPVLVECVIRPGSRKDLGRPTSTPKQNKANFMEFLNK